MMSGDVACSMHVWSPFFVTWFNHSTQGASVSRSREGRWGVRHGNLKSWVLQCYLNLDQFGVFCTLCLSEFIRVYRDLTPQWLAHPVWIHQKCAYKNVGIFFPVALKKVQVPQVQVIEVTKQLPKASGKKTQNQNLQTEDCLNSSKCLKVLISKIAKDCSKSIEPW